MATDVHLPADPDGPTLDDGASARRRRTRRIVGWSIVGLVLVIVAVVAWVGIRGLLAKKELDSALPYAKTIQSSITAGDIPAASTAAARLRNHAREAASLTGDPIWRAAELVPGAGPNLAAVRQAAAATDVVAAKVIAPLVGVAHDADPTHIKPVGGAIDLTPVTRAQPVVARAQSAFHGARASVDGIEVGGTIGPVRDAVERLSHMLSTAAPAIDAVGNTARLLPGMLGADGPRTYLLLAQNPAEVRATGGLVGAMALIRADHGKISLVAQEASTSIHLRTQPVSAIPAATQGLYGPYQARAIQAVNLTPDFPLAAQSAAALWKDRFGGTIDGVVGIDPVALSYLLKVVGPVTLPSGDSLTSHNAVRLLLSEAYQRWTDPHEQDAFFASAASAVFSAVASGKGEGTSLVKALAKAGQERRMFVWSADAKEQAILGSTTLAGGLPVSDSSTAGIGVYFNDATAAKMDYYLDSRVDAGTAVCRSDGTPSTRVTVTLTNTAPADAATALPLYVTGTGEAGVPRGWIRTRVAVYGAEGGLLAGTSSGGKNYPTIAGTDAGRPVSVFTVDLAPGQSKTVVVDLLNVLQVKPGMSVIRTPALPGRGAPAGSAPDVGVSGAASVVALHCDSTVK